MRTIHLVLAVSVAAVAMPAAIYAGTRIRPIHPERQAMSPSARHDAVLRDLNSILSGPASPTSVVTKAYPSDQPGLCRRDVIRISYVQVGDGPKAPFNPQGVEVGTQYFYLGDTASRAPSAFKAACASHGGTDQHWVSSADGEDFAASALVILAQAVENVRAGRVTVACEEVQDECGAKQFLEAAPQTSSTFRCDGKGADCYYYDLGAYVATITDGYDGNSRHTTIKIAPAPIVVT